ncbi:MAG: short-chain dehydrogenase/reductase [Solirubrobacterales bacterium]|jgi:3-oxoacyl-[acyl-carrier protein] reductase|nr:short-chain dehydrogenase/reductase [Solirubrobacterales bacterium]
MRPDGACALVTGGGRGIGAASAAALAADGWRVALVSRSGGNGADLHLTADVTDADAMAGAFAEIEERLGPVLCVVNNAGITADNLALSLEDDEWDRVIDTNLTAAFKLTRRAMRGMLRARYGRIVNIASVVGPRANAGQANYAASKAGLIGLTKTVAAEVARKGVTVNAVAPGFIDTHMTAGVAEAVKQAVPARRAGRPEEVAACVRFLASDAASYVTGTTLYVDGGLAA